MIAWTLVLALAPAADDGLVATPKDAGAADEKLVDDTAPPAEQDALKVFQGSWRCSGKANTEMAPDVPMDLTFTAKPDGRWWNVRIEEPKNKNNPRPASSSEVWGYSRAAASFVMNGADGQGGFHHGTSQGWVGDRFTWAIDTTRNAKPAKLRRAFTKKSERQLDLSIAVDPTGTGDSFRVTFEGSCKK